MARLRIVSIIVVLVALTACNVGGLPPGGTYQQLQGVVTDSVTNQPIAGATVTVDTVLIATTDAAGKFSFAQVPVGEIDYEVTAPPSQQYKPLAGTAQLSPNKPLTLTVNLSH